MSLVMFLFLIPNFILFIIPRDARCVLLLEVIFYNEMRYINLRFTYLLTYLLLR